MKGLFLALAATGVLAVAALAFGYAASPASAHRSGCHSAHVCPSDHATYRWRGWLCVAPYSSKRTNAYRKQIRWEGRTYLCKR